MDITEKIEKFLTEKMGKVKVGELVNFHNDDGKMSTGKVTKIEKDKVAIKAVLPSNIRGTIFKRLIKDIYEA